MRFLFTIAAFLVTLVVVSVAAFIVVIFLAGPHAGILPKPLEVAVVILGWLSVLVLPSWAAWAVWRRLSRKKPSDNSPH